MYMLIAKHTQQTPKFYFTDRQPSKLIVLFRTHINSAKNEERPDCIYIR